MNLLELKQLVEKSGKDALQEVFQEILEGCLELDVECDYLFQKIYLHACLKDKHEIALWLEKDVFPTLPAIQQTSIRQVFAYGHYLLSKHSKK